MLLGIYFLTPEDIKIDYNTSMDWLSRKNFINQTGFTLVELMATITILAMFYAMVMVNFNLWRGPQFVKLGASEVAANIYKARADSLSAKNMGNLPAKYYILQFSANADSNRSYILQGISSDGSGGNKFYIWPDTALGTFMLPGTAYVKSFSVTTPDGAILNDKTCLQVAFSLPYGKTYIDPECRLDNNISNPSTIGYNPIFSLTSLDSVANSKATIVLAWPGGSQTKSIVVDGVSGRVEIQ